MYRRQSFICLAATALFASLHAARAAPTPEAWQGWSFLIGKWTGAAEGTPGSALGEMTFSYDLGRNVILRRGETSFPAQNGRAAFVHNDLTVIYREGTGGHVKADYWDNEGHTIYYTAALSQDGKSAVFTGAVVPHQPRFRLTYAVKGPDSLEVAFAMAPAEHPEEFKAYVSGTVRKVGG